MAGVLVPDLIPTSDASIKAALKAIVKFFTDKGPTLLQKIAFYGYIGAVDVPSIE